MKGYRRTVMVARTVLGNDPELPAALRTFGQVPFERDGNALRFQIVTRGDHVASVRRLVIQADHATSVFILHHPFRIVCIVMPLNKQDLIGPASRSTVALRSDSAKSFRMPSIGANSIPSGKFERGRVPASIVLITNSVIQLRLLQAERAIVGK